MTDQPTKPKRGGSRPGAGRKALPGIVRTAVSLDRATLDKASALGQGNVSLGIRKRFAKDGT